MKTENNFVGSILNLSDDLLLKEGATRSVYKHPYDSSKCIKVLRVPRVRNFKTFKKFLRLHLLGFNPNKNELRNYKKVLNTEVSGFLPKLGLDMVDTNLGKGLVCETIKDFDGDISKQIYKYSSNGKYSVEIKEQLESFFVILIENNIFFYDFNLNNFMVQLKKSNGGVQKKLIYSDLKSLNKTKSFIKIERVFRSLAKMKLRRRVEQFYERIGLSIPEKIKGLL